MPVELPVGTFSSDGRLLAYVSRGYTVKLWDTVTKQVVRTLGGHGWIVCALNFSPDGRLLATSSFDNSTCVWDVAEGRAAPQKLDGQSSVLWFSHDSRTLVTADRERSVRFWNLASGQETLTIGNATGALLAPDDSALLLWRGAEASLIRIPTLTEIDEAIRETQKSPDVITEVDLNE
jgi:WD40 repeat protein